MIWLILIIVLLISGVVTLLYLIRIAENKISLYEEFILERQTAYENLLLRLKEIDSKELFEKDDEVGVIFTSIKEEIEEFKTIIE